MRINKAIILAGGNAKRLYPTTKVTSKHLLNIYNKPMIFYSLSTLMLGGIRKFLIITSKNQINNYKKLLGNGKKLGININYAVQKKPRGLPEAFIIAKKFINNNPVCLNLGDHIFFGNDVVSLLKKNINNFKKSTIFAYEKKSNNLDYGLIKFNKFNKPIAVVEKPKQKISNFIVSGLYIFDQNVYKLCKKLKPSRRNELEITDLINYYLDENSLNIEFINSKIYWIDAGTPEDIIKASNLIYNLENKKNSYYGYLEIIAYKKGYINLKEFRILIDSYENNQYGSYLFNYLKNYL